MCRNIRHFKYECLAYNKACAANLVAREGELAINVAKLAKLPALAAGIQRRASAPAAGDTRCCLKD